MRSGCVAMRCHVNWQHLRRNLSLRSGLLTPSIWFAPTRHSRSAPMCPIVMPMQLQACQMPGWGLDDARCPVPGATIRADYACALSDTLLISALTFCGFSFIQPELFIILYIWLCVAEGISCKCCSLHLRIDLC